MLPASPSASEYVAPSVGTAWLWEPSAGDDNAAAANAFGAGWSVMRLFGSYGSIQTLRVVLPAEVVPAVWWRQNWTQRRSLVSSVVALVVVYETETVWLVLLSAIAFPSVTGMIVPPAMVLPLVSTFHIATDRSAEPVTAESGRNWRLKVHMPAGNVNPALEST